MSRAAHAPLRPQVAHQLFFQCAPGLNEQATVNRFVGHAQPLVVGILVLQPPGNLRPISCNDSPAFQRLQTSRFSIAESPNRIPSLIPTPPLQSRFTSD